MKQLISLVNLLYYHDIGYCDSICSEKAIHVVNHTLVHSTFLNKLIVARHSFLDSKHQNMEKCQIEEDAVDNVIDLRELRAKGNDKVRMAVN